jgi:MerR family transcriptional regulator, thiopeptide resistance regulator
MTTNYRAREFAELGAVTVRTLHHYEKLGLLKPKRSSAGYRLFSLRDLERLEQIVALKFVGVRLKQIQVLLNRDALAMPDALRAQLQILEDRHELLDRAITAIHEALTAMRSGKSDQVDILRTITGAIKMPDNADFRKKYFDKQSWAKLTKIRKQATPQSNLEKTRAWINLLCDVEAARGQNPASKAAQTLAARWMQLVERSTQGDVGIREGWTKAWADRQHWPAPSKRVCSNTTWRKLRISSRRQ